MAEEAQLVESLRSIAEIARAQGNALTKEEVRRYLAGMDLTEGQQEHIFAYLSEIGISVREAETGRPMADVEAADAEAADDAASVGRVMAGAEADVAAASERPMAEAEEDADGASAGKTAAGAEADVAAASEKPMAKAKEDADGASEGKSVAGAGAGAEPGEGEAAPIPLSPRKREAPPKTKKEDSRFLRMYLDDLQGCRRLGREEEQAFMEGLLRGEEEAKSALLEHWLFRVVDIARTYEGRGALLEDLIQEGNLGLLDGLDALFGSAPFGDVGSLECEERLAEAVERAILGHVEMIERGNDLKGIVVAKASLVNEAAKYLEGELGRAATKEELSWYARIPMDEIEDILRLSADSIKVADGERK